MRRAIPAIFIASVLYALAAPETTTITGTVYTPSGAVVTAGYVTCTLTTPGTTPDGASTAVVGGDQRFAISSGGAVSSMALVPNDAITPAGTRYNCRFVATAPRRVEWTRSNCYVQTSPDPLTIGAMQCDAEAAALPAVPGAAGTLLRSNGSGGITALTCASVDMVPSWDGDSFECAEVSGVGGGGDDVTVDGTATTDPNLADSTDVAFSIDGSSNVTATIVATGGMASGTVLTSNGSGSLAAGTGLAISSKVAALSMKYYDVDSNGDGTVDERIIGDYDGDGTLEGTDIEQGIESLLTAIGASRDVDGDGTTNDAGVTFTILPGKFRAGFRDTISINRGWVTVRGSGRDSTLIDIDADASGNQDWNSDGRIDTLDDGNTTHAINYLFLIYGGASRVDHVTIENLAINGGSLRWIDSQKDTDGDSVSDCPGLFNASTCSTGNPEGAASVCDNSDYCCCDAHDPILHNGIGSFFTVRNVDIRNGDRTLIATLPKDPPNEGMLVQNAQLNGAGEHGITAHFSRVQIDNVQMTNGGGTDCILLAVPSATSPPDFYDASVTNSTFLNWGVTCISTEATTANMGDVLNITIANNILRHTGGATNSSVMAIDVVGQQESSGTVDPPQDTYVGLSRVSITDNVLDLTDVAHPTQGGIGIDWGNTDYSDTNSEVATISGNVLRWRQSAKTMSNGSFRGIRIRGRNASVSSNVIDITQGAAVGVPVGIYVAQEDSSPTVAPGRHLSISDTHIIMRDDVIYGIGVYGDNVAVSDTLITSHDTALSSSSESIGIHVAKSSGADNEPNNVSIRNTTVNGVVSNGVTIGQANNVSVSQTQCSDMDPGNTNYARCVQISGTGEPLTVDGVRKFGNGGYAVESGTSGRGIITDSLCLDNEGTTFFCGAYPGLTLPGASVDADAIAAPGWLWLVDTNLDGTKDATVQQYYSDATALNIDDDLPTIKFRETSWIGVGTCGSSECLVYDIDADGTIDTTDACLVAGGSDENCDGTADAGIGGGDEVSVDGTATTNPNFVDGDIDFTADASSNVSATIRDEKVVEADLKVGNSPADEACLTYEATTGDFEWQTCNTYWEIGGDGVDLSEINTAADTPSDGECLKWAAGSGEVMNWGACGPDGGDEVSVDGTATTTPNFSDGGDIDFAIDGSNNVTGSVKADIIDGAELADTITLDANTSIATGAYGLTVTVSNPTSPAFDVNGTGAFSDDLVHFHQHTGNPTAGNILHVEAVDVDIDPLVHITSAATDLTASVTSLLIDAYDADDADWTPIAVVEDADGTPATVFSVDKDGVVTAGGYSQTSAISDCDGDGSAVMYDATTKAFSCGDDDSVSGGVTVSVDLNTDGTNESYTVADSNADGTADNYHPAAMVSRFYDAVGQDSASFFSASLALPLGTMADGDGTDNAFGYTHCSLGTTAYQDCYLSMSGRGSGSASSSYYVPGKMRTFQVRARATLGTGSQLTSGRKFIGGMRGGIDESLERFSVGAFFYACPQCDVDGDSTQGDVDDDGVCGEAGEDSDDCNWWAVTGYGMTWGCLTSSTVTVDCDEDGTTESKLAGTAFSFTNTTVAATNTSTFQTFEIRCAAESSGNCTQYDYYINGTSRASHSTGAPPNTQYVWGWAVWAENLGNTVASQMGFDWLYYLGRR